MATTQVHKRPSGSTIVALAAGVAVALAAAGADAGTPNWMPLLPDQDFYDFQMFAPPDLQEYSVRPDPQEGLFFTYDRLYWALTPPQSIGILNDFFIPVQPLAPQAVAQLNNNLIRAGYPGSGLYIFGADPLRLDLTTNWMRTNMTWGNRFEGGWIYDDYGMLFSYYETGPQSQSFVTTNAFAVNSPTTEFSQTPVAGGGFVGGNVLVVTTIQSESPPPDHLITQTLTQANSTDLRSAGFSWIVRRNLSAANSGSLNLVRFAVGPKFFQLTDRYSIAYGSVQEGFVEGVPQGEPTPLQFGGWNTSSYNNMVGPEFGIDWTIERGRWTFETDLRFTAGMNWQNTLYNGSNFPVALGADFFRSTYTFANTVAQGTNTSSPVAAPPLFVQIYGVGQTNATNTAEHNFVFSPMGEWRLRARYKVSRAISLNLGYTGMWLAGITRASTNTSFQPTVRPVVTAAQNGPNIESPVLDAAGQIVGSTQVPSWTPPPVNPGNTSLREYNRIGPAVGNDLGYVFVNGVDFGLEVNY